jgi:hypothetical protein
MKSFPWGFYVVCCLLLAVGALLHWQGGDLAKGIGEATMISAILAATVDVFVKRRFLKEISWDVSKYLIGYSLPEEIQDRIRELMATRLMTYEWEVRYRLTPVPDTQPATIQLEVSYCYKVENLTSQKQDYQQHLQFEKRDKAEIRELRCDSKDTAANYVLSGDNLARESPDQAGVVEAKGTKIKIPPGNTKAGQIYRISGRYALTLPSDYRDSIVFMQQPAKTVAITVEAPETLEFSASPPADVHTRHRWDYNRVFTPGQHLRLRWFTRSQELPAKSNEPTTTTSTGETQQTAPT